MFTASRSAGCLTASRTVGVLPTADLRRHRRYWLLWNLTGGATHRCDMTNASRTQLFNIHTLDWDDELLAAFGIPRAAMPEIAYSSSHFGETVGVGTLPAGTPIGSMIGDSHGAMYSHGQYQPGAVKATYGTGSSLMSPVEQVVISDHGLSTTVGWADHTPVLALEGNIYVTGAAVQWVRDLLGSSRRRPSRNWRRRWRILRACTLCLRSWGWGRRTGTTARAPDNGPDAGQQPGACGEGRDRIDRLSDPRRFRCHGGGVPVYAVGSAGRRRSKPQRYAHAVPGGHFRVPSVAQQLDSPFSAGGCIPCRADGRGVVVAERRSRLCPAHRSL